jgi:phage/conjugal plasmid C-4 type zinc finger TraR family protein
MAVLILLLVLTHEGQTAIIEPCSSLCFREVAMAGGFAKDGAVQDQIDATIEDAVERARSQLPCGESLGECEECGEAIPAARRKAVPGVRHCVACQEAEDAEQADVSAYNRRGSKDSQLR